MPLCLQDVEEHPESDAVQEAGKELLELGDGELVGDARAEGSGEGAHGNDARQSGEVDEAQGPVRQIGDAPAVGDVAQATRAGDGEADGDLYHGGISGTGGTG